LKALPTFRATELVYLFLRKPIFDGYLKEGTKGFPLFLVSKKVSVNREDVGGKQVRKFNRNEM